MSKKRLNRRLDGLFDHLQQEISTLEEIQGHGWRWSCDGYGHYLSCSQEVESYLGYPPEEINGQKVSEFALSAASGLRLSEALASGSYPLEIELRYIDRDGHPLQAEVAIHQEPASGNGNGHARIWQGVTRIVEQRVQPDAPIEKGLTALSDSTEEQANPAGWRVGLEVSEGQSTPVLPDEEPQSSDPANLPAQEATPNGNSASQPSTLAMQVSVPGQEQSLVMEIQDQDPARYWSEDERLLVEEVAEQMALTIQSAQLFAETQARAEEMDNLRSLALELALEQRDIKAVMQTVVQRATQMLSTDQGSLWLWDEKTSSLKLGTARQPVGGARNDPSAQQVDAARQAFTTHQAVLIKPGTPSPHNPNRSILAQPLMWQAQPFGSLVVERNDETFTNAEQSLLELIAAQAAAAIQNARLFASSQMLLEDLQSRAVQLQTAAEVSRAASSILDTAHLLQQTADLIRERFSFYYVGIFLVDFNGTWTNEPGKWAVLRAGTGEAGSIQIAKGHKLEIGGRSMIGTCVSSAQPRVSQVASLEAQRYINPILPETRSEMALPLISRGKVIGAMTIQDSQPNAFSDEDVAALQTMADQLANAIQNAALFEQVQQALSETELRAHELAVLNQMSRAFATEQEIEAILENIYRYAAQLMDTSNFYVALYHRDRERLTFHHVYEDGGLVTPEHPSWSEWHADDSVSGLTGYVIRQRAPILVNQDALQYFDDQDIPHIDIGTGGVQSWLGVPMMIGEDVLGVITVQSETQPNLYTLRHQELLMAMGNQAAIALQNANLLEETRRRNQHLAALNNIIQSASHSLDLTESMNQILEQILGLIKFDAGLISAVDPETGRLRLIHQKNLPEPLHRRLVEQGLEGTLCDLVFQRGDLINLENLRTAAPMDVTSLLNMGLVSYLGVPIIAHGNVTGTVCVFGHEPQVQSHAMLELMAAIGRQVGMTVDRAWLFDQTQVALRETERLYQVSAQLNQARNYDDVLQVLRKHSILGRGEHTLLSLVYYDSPWNSDNVPQWLEVIARWSPDARLMRGPRRLSLPAFQWLVENFTPEHPIIIEDVDAVAGVDENTLNWLRQGKFRSAILLPLVVGGEWRGFISSFYGEVLEIAVDEQQTLGAVTGQAAVAVQGLQLLAEAKRRADQLETAAEIARESSSTLALDVLLNHAVELIRARFDYYHASIFLLDEEEKYAQVRASTGGAGRELLRRAHRLMVGSQSIVGYVTANGVPLVVNDVRTDPVHRPNPLLPDTQSELGIPLKIGERVIGALDVQSTQVNAFTPDNIQVLQILASQIAIALENARAYELSQQAIEEMSKADRLKSQFLANMSHELRTPLNSIIGFSRVILKGIDGPVNELQEQDLTAIHKSGQHLLNLINDILDLSKIEAGKMDLNLEEDVRLEDVVQSVMPTIKGMIKDKPIELHAEVENNLPKVKADPLKLRQVMINLLSNAAKFTEAGEITVRVARQSEETKPGNLLVSVTDTGPGIAAEDLEKLFQPFSQVDASPTRKTGGSGLGLSICRSLVEMHGGQIGVESTPGTGSTFYFTLPLQDTRPGHEAGLNVILALDPDPQILALYQRYLRDSGVVFEPYTDFEQASARLRQHPPAMLTIDPSMQQGAGWELLAALRAEPATQNIAVIICTLALEQERAAQLGASKYLLKPILEQDLVQAVQSVLTDKSS